MAKIKDEGIPVVDLRFVDLPGLWHHFTVSAKEFSADVFDEGIGFDGSSIRGFQQIQESDMLLFPDPSSAFVDPFAAEKTLCLICNVKDPTHRRVLHAGPASHRPEGRGVSEVDRHRRHRLLRSRARVLHLRRHPVRADLQRGLLPHRRERGLLERRPGGEPGRPPATRATSATSRGTRKATSRCRPWTATKTCAPRCSWPSKKSAWRSRSITTRWARRARPRSTCASTSLVSMGDKLMKYKYLRQERRPPPWQDGDADAEAHLPGQRVGHARPPERVEGRQEPVLRGGAPTATSARRRSTTSAASSSTPRRCSR